MASFDFVEAASDAYKFVWKKRQILAGLAAIPVLVKAVTLAGIIFLGLSENYLRQGLLLMPAYFLEGVLLVQVVRMAVLEAGGSVKTSPVATQRAIAGGAALYLLTKVFLSFVVGLGFQLKEVEVPEASGDPDVSKFMFLIMVLVLLIWAFRFLWIYILPALGYRIKDFLKKTRGYMLSFYILGAFFLCYVPFEILNQISYEALKMVFPHGEAGPTDAFLFARAPMISAFDVAFSLVASVAMALGFRAIMEDLNEKPDFF